WPPFMHNHVVGDGLELLLGQFLKLGFVVYKVVSLDDIKCWNYNTLPEWRAKVLPVAVQVQDSADRLKRGADNGTPLPATTLLLASPEQHHLADFHVLAHFAQDGAADHR